ncbi:MAG: multidrug transporter AcrB [Coxiellaceae bacterium]|nr:multidrug transporter AcrB [Coxiellaceae bacterium]|tara:strand:+ start:85 stop:3159 length:3075 start_codon:yes stop_codon:yes gene_type:complete
MNLSVVCIKRPVLATVLSLVLIILGLLAFTRLSVNYLPDFSTNSINVSTAWDGASASYMEENITTPLEDVISAVSGIDYIESTSIKGGSSISLTLNDHADYNEVMNDVRTRVDMSLKRLPDNLPSSPIVKEGYRSTSLLRIAISDPNMPLQNLQDFVTRNIEDQISQIEGVGDVRSHGADPYSMVITVDPQKLKTLHLSVREIAEVIADANTQEAAGTITGKVIDFPLNLDTSLKTIQDFKDIVVKNDNGTLLSVKDIASVELKGFATTSVIAKYNGEPAIILEVNTTNDANEIQTATAVKQFLEQLKPSLPEGLTMTPFSDMSIFMNASVDEVYTAIAFAVLFVIFVILIFLGNLRSVFIPVITIPICLISTFALMYVLGFSINMVTLIAIVLSVGLVVDDAIVVLENTYRRIEAGESPQEAAINGSKEIVFAIVVMTLTLAAVYAPFGFMTGMAAAFLTPFAFTLAGAVIISGFVSLTLSPMMCSKLLVSPTAVDNNIGRFSLARWQRCVEQLFGRLIINYQTILGWVLQQKYTVLLSMIIIVIVGGFFARSVPFNALPDEDVGLVFVVYHAPVNEDVKSVETKLNTIVSLTHGIDAISSTVSLAQGNNIHGAPSFVIMQLKPWSERMMSSEDVQNIMNQRIKQATGINAMAHAIGGSHAGYDGVEFLLYGASDYDQLYKNASSIMSKLQSDNPHFQDMRTDIAYDMQEYDIVINRIMAAKLNVPIQEITDTVATLLGTQNVTSFTLSSFSYYTYLLADASLRSDLYSLLSFYVKSSTGDMIPLSELVSLKPAIRQSQLPHYNRQQSTSITAQFSKDYSMAEAIQYLNQELPSLLPSGVSFTFSGDALDAINSNSSTATLFLLAVVFIYLILAAQFESFLDPLIILLCVPLSIVFALLCLRYAGGTINMYTVIGLITLIGLIAKHGILITQFANTKLDQGESIFDAIMSGSSVRLRPILMTTAAMVMGALPLMLSSGAGANSRHQIGLVIVSGMLGGTLFSLFIVPAAYMVFKQLKLRFRKS